MQKVIEVKDGDKVHLNSGSPDLKVARQDADQLEVGESGLQRLRMPAVCFRRTSSGS
jgi:hypothetical protein